MKKADEKLLNILDGISRQLKLAAERSGEANRFNIAENLDLINGHVNELTEDLKKEIEKEV